MLEECVNLVGRIKTNLKKKNNGWNRKKYVVLNEILNNH